MRGRFAGFALVKRGAINRQVRGGPGLKNGHSHRLRMLQQKTKVACHASMQMQLGGVFHRSQKKFHRMGISFGQGGVGRGFLLGSTQAIFAWALHSTDGVSPTCHICVDADPNRPLPTPGGAGGLVEVPEHRSRGCCSSTPPPLHPARTAPRPRMVYVAWRLMMGAAGEGDSLSSTLGGEGEGTCARREWAGFVGYSWQWKKMLHSRMLGGKGCVDWGLAQPTAPRRAANPSAGGTPPGTKGRSLSSGRSPAARGTAGPGR